MNGTGCSGRLPPTGVHSAHAFLGQVSSQKSLILDAGGGPGRYTIELAKKGYQVVLLDLSPKCLEIAKREIKNAKVEDHDRLVF